jgi:glycosyl transferase family 25
MKIFIINLSTAIERRQFQKKQMSKLDLNYEFVEATSIHDISDETYAKHLHDWQRPLRNTEVACYFSHRSLWQKIIDNNSPALILEDDALVSKCVPELLKSFISKKNVDFINLEVAGRKKFISKIGEDIACNSALFRLYQDRTGAAGYVLWPSGAKKLLRHESSNGIGLADSHIASCYSLKSYQVEPAAIIQLDKCDNYNVKIPYSKTLSSSTISHVKKSKSPFFFSIKRLSAQLKLGFHAAKILTKNSSRRFINLNSDNFL